ncbi:hypothetical protein ACIQUU_32235 [Streptomyces sp. NPDC101116]|uniref:hypothetical protein n=1 Tax=Streptomyces sp. NPDC101116 TaxID=3366107 RepID=UPI00382D1BBF
MAFGRNSKKPDHDVAEDIERGKREGSQLSRIAHAHQKLDQGRPAPDKSSGKGLSGPSSPDASTPQKRRWGR